MVEVQNPGHEPTHRSIRLRHLPTLAAALVVLVGLALFPNRDTSPKKDWLRNLDLLSSLSLTPASLVDPGSREDIGTRVRRVGFVGLPPEEARPSMPENGELVLQFVRVPATPRWGWVYADGRVIRWWYTDLPEGANDRVTGLLEQRLKLEGVELLLSDIFSTAHFPYNDDSPFDRILIRDRDGFLRWGNSGLTKSLADLDSWLPADAWEDRELRAYVPSRFEVCYLSGVLSLLPARAQDLLLAKGTHPHSLFGVGCSAMTTEEARTLADTIDRWLARGGGVGGPAESSWYHQSYRIDASGLDEPESIWFEPYLPHGEMLCSQCG